VILVSIGATNAISMAAAAPVATATYNGATTTVAWKLAAGIHDLATLRANPKAPQAYFGPSAPVFTEDCRSFQVDVYMYDAAHKPLVDALVAGGTIYLAPKTPNDALVFISAQIVTPPCGTGVTPEPPTVKPVCGPDNDVVTLPTVDGVEYTITKWKDGKSTVKAVATKGHVLKGDAEWTFTDDNVACDKPVTPEPPTVKPVCGPDNDVVTLPTVDGVEYTITKWKDGKSTVKAVATKGHVLKGDAEWTFTDDNVACDKPVTPEPPTVKPVCGPDNDVVTLPTVDGVEYTSSGWKNGKLTVTADAKKGHVLEGRYKWTFTDDAAPCVVAVETVPPSVSPVCGPDNDNGHLPVVVGVEYTSTGWKDGHLTVNAAPKPGYRLTGLVQWTFVDANVACPVTAKPGSKPVYAVANTGIENLEDVVSDPRSIIIFALLLSGCAFVLWRRGLLSVPSVGRKG
jgi:phosphohistidine swiveling domain-containing protein